MREKIWKKVTYPGVRKDYYLISEDGQVMNIVTGKILSPYYHGGYYRVNIASDKKSSRGYSVFTHRLVAWEFVPNPNHLESNLLHPSPGIASYSFPIVSLSPSTCHLFPHPEFPKKDMMHLNFHDGTEWPGSQGTPRYPDYPSISVHKLRLKSSHVG